MATRFVAEGADVAALDIDGDAVSSLARRIGASAWQLDVADEVQIKAAVHKIEDSLGPIDVFCFNAGIATGGGVEASNQDWQRTWEVNVISHVYGARAVLPSMLANRGVIECYGIAPIVADRDAVPVGARGADEPGYPGRAYLAEGPGRAEVVEWSPNRAVVRYDGAAPGALLVYNMNFDPGWRAGETPALNHEHAVAAPS